LIAAAVGLLAAPLLGGIVRVLVGAMEARPPASCTHDTMPDWRAVEGSLAFVGPSMAIVEGPDGIQEGLNTIVEGSNGTEEGLDGAEEGLNATVEGLTGTIGGPFSLVASSDPVPAPMPTGASSLGHPARHPTRSRRETGDAWGATPGLAIASRARARSGWWPALTGL
jgi:hypothetical protein